jgi:hypothetical protein
MIPFHLDLALRAIGVMPPHKARDPQPAPEPYVAWRPSPGNTEAPF